jgi:hypothetical protein
MDLTKGIIPNAKINFRNVKRTEMERGKKPAERKAEKATALERRKLY